MEPADTARGSAGGCLRAVLYALIGFAWFFAAQNAVWWYSRAFHIPHGPGPDLRILAMLLAGWPAVMLAVYGVHRLHQRLWPRWPAWVPVPGY